MDSEEEKNLDNEHFNFNIVFNTLDMWYDLETAKKAIDSELAIIGYPGEREKRGYAYKGSGKLIEVEKTQSGGLIARYKAYTTPGVSGAPVRIASQHMIQLAIDYQKKWAEGGWLASMLILAEGVEDRNQVYCGIHTGFDKEKQMNFCTFVTPELNGWRDTILKCFECE